MIASLSVGISHTGGAYSLAEMHLLPAPSLLATGTIRRNCLGGIASGDIIFT